jgi:hypothetical protein
MAFPAGVFFGIASHNGAYIQKVTKAKKADRKDLLDSQGEIGVMHWHKSRTEFTVEGSGTPTVSDVGVGSSGLTGLVGGVQGIDEFTTEEGNENYGSFKYSGIHAPAAVAG